MPRSSIKSLPTGKSSVKSSIVRLYKLNAFSYVQHVALDHFSVVSAWIKLKASILVLCSVVQYFGSGSSALSNFCCRLRGAPTRPTREFGGILHYAAWYYRLRNMLRSVLELRWVSRIFFLPWQRVGRHQPMCSLRPTVTAQWNFN